MTVGDTMWTYYVGVFAVWLVPPLVAAFGATLVLRRLGLAASVVPRVALALFALSLLAFALGAVDTWTWLEARRWLAWPLAPALAGASIGVMAAGVWRGPLTRASLRSPSRPRSP